MVGEFPELQGIIGGIYAGVQGESKVVAEAIYDHYKPEVLTRAHREVGSAKSWLWPISWILWAGCFD